MNATDANQVEARAARVILDRGVRFKMNDSDGVTIRPLRYGAVLMIAAHVAESGLTEKELEEGGTDVFTFFQKYSSLMAECIAIAECPVATLRDDEDAARAAIAERVAWYEANLTVIQMYELFAHVISVSGIQDFMNTIRLILTMKRMSLSPRRRGS
jgi:hypothetical protein